MRAHMYVNVAPLFPTRTGGAPVNRNKKYTVSLGAAYAIFKLSSSYLQLIPQHAELPSQAECRAALGYKSSSNHNTGTASRWAILELIMHAFMSYDRSIQPAN